MASPDHYGALGLEPDADERAVKRAYRKAARECHPDLPENKGSASAARRWQEIRQAYDVLSDAEKRAHYDRWGRDGVSAAGKDWHASWHSGPNATAPGGDADDIELDTQVGSGVASIFESLFGDTGDTGSSKGGGGTVGDNPWSRTDDGGGRAATGSSGPPPSDLWSPERLNREGRASAEDGVSDRPAGWGPPPRAKGVRTNRGGGGTGASSGGVGSSTVRNSDPEGVEEASPWRPSIRRSGETEDGASRTGIGGLDYDGLVQAAFGGGEGAVGEPPPAPTRAEIDAATYGRGPGPRVRATNTTPSPPPREEARAPGVSSRAARSGAPARRGAEFERGPEPSPEAEAPEGAFETSGDAFGAPRETLEPEPPPGPSRRRARRSSRRATDEPPPDALRLTVSVPFLTALHGGSRQVTFRVPDADGNWSLQRVDVVVPPGTTTGTTVRLAGQGHVGTDGARGDLFLDLVAEEHPFFTIDGCNVLLDVPITPLEAAGGVRLDVPTVHGSTRVSVAPGVRAGERIVLRGLGLPDPDQPGRKGTQILTVLIQLPPRLNGEQLDLLAKLDASSNHRPRTGIWDEEP